MEAWIEKALDHGIFQIDIWYFIGMPEQDAKSVMETVDYCQHLLEKFKGQRVQPLICPMIPFLDPASTFYEDPVPHGYRVFYRTLEEHRRAMQNASILNRINYETQWLSRRDLVYEGYRAVRRLMQAKSETGLLPKSSVQDFNAKIDDALDFIDEVHEADCIQDSQARKRALERLGDGILRRNQMIFHSGVVNQAFPIARHIGGRWFDDMGWDASVLESGEQG